MEHFNNSSVSAVDFGSAIFNYWTQCGLIMAQADPLFESTCAMQQCLDRRNVSRLFTDTVPVSLRGVGLAQNMTKIDPVVTRSD